MYRGSLLSLAMSEITCSGIMCPLPRHFKPRQLSTCRGGSPEWSTPRRSHCSQICLRCRTMWVSICHLFCLCTSIFLWCSTPPPSLSFLDSADYYYIFRLIIHKNRIKTSACIHHIVFATVQNNKNNWKTAPCCLWHLVRLSQAPVLLITLYEDDIL
jgi:hypothetical protein